MPLTFQLEILDMANGDVPFAGVAVYAWHCTAQGEYSMYSTGIEDATYLRGVQVADDSGLVSFTSIFPGCYSGRWPHIHFEVYPDAGSITDSTNAISTSQLALPQDACEAVYADSRYSGSAQNLTGWHALIILAIIVLIFGAAKLPALARSVGQSMRILKTEAQSPEESPAETSPEAADPAPPTIAVARVSE